MLLMWDTVLADCNGQPESAIVYEIAADVRTITGWQPYTQEDGTVTQMPIYSAPNLTVVGTVSAPTVTLSDIDLEPGAIEYIRVTSVDEAGNRDEDSCT